MICRRKGYFLVLLMVCLLSFVAKGQEMNIIFKHDFENNTLGVYNPGEWKRDWNEPTWASRLNETYIVEKSGSKAMKWIYPLGTWGINNELGGGGQWEAPIPGFHTEIYMSYNMMVRPGFDFVLSGKLPGIKGGSGDGYSAGTPPLWEDGFSNGLAFQGKNDPRGNIAFYLYHQDQIGSYGDLLKWPDPYNDKESLFVFKKDNVNELWVNVALRIVMNTIKSDGSGGNNDGILEGFINGKLMYKNSGLRFRNVSTIGIDKMKIYSFFGGSGDQYATTRDEWMIFDDFYLFTYSEGEDVPRGNTPSSAGRDLKLPWLKYITDTIPSEENDSEPPTIPGNLKASAISQNSISISWDPSTDNVAVAGYRIFVDSSLNSAISGTEYEIKGLISGKEYTITVSSYDAASNESKKSTSINAKTLELDTEPPTVPSGIELSNVTALSVELNWQPSVDNTGVDHYEVRLNGNFKAFTDAINYVVSGLSPNTNYAITLRAIDAAGNLSPFSAAVTWLTEAPDEQSPSRPVGLKAGEVTKQSIQLTWNPAIDNVAVSSYKIHVNNDVMSESTVNEEKIEGLIAGLTYVISVSALDEAGNESDESDTIHVTTPNNDFTTKPTMAEVSIVELHTESTNPSSLSEMKSLGHVELESFGIIVTQGNQIVEEGSPIFAEKALTNVDSKGRVTDGLQLLYNFSDGQGNIVSEISGVGEPLDLFINRPLNTTWLPGQGLKVDGNTTLLYEGTPSRLINALKSTNEITIEAWISQFETEQNGPARIVTLSDGNSNRAVTLGHEGNKVSYNYVTRLATTITDSNGLPEFATFTNFTNNSLHHVVYTRTSKGIEKLFVNGIELSSGERGGDFSSWTGEYKFALGNEPNGERPWNGAYYLVAIYNKALSSDAIIQNYQTGFGKIQYKTELSELKPNTSYFLCPFVKTDQGIVYGARKSFLIENVLFSEGDSIYMAVYPNPSNGDFKLHVEYENSTPQKALLRIADLSGKIIQSRELKFNDEYVTTEIDINLQNQIAVGIYSALLIVGNRAIARKIVIY